ncbi:MAG: NAD-dependent epimerase/dehydratase family protein, partial [Spirochaetaceae bacterium]|nr:NAD-dependent epimerase/dehydratase family protein [Spirochaetaceae bacterium]
PALLITGGSGFVGRAMLRELLSSDPVIDASEIRVFDLHKPAEPLNDPRINYIRGDIRDAGALETAAAGTDAIIHLASMVDWGTHPPKTVYSINVDGTRNALNAAQAAGVAAFVYTSSLDSVITGKPLRNVDESLPYPEKHPNAYCGSKAAAERLVAAADGTHDEGTLRTVIIRPAGVWGEADPYHISALVNLAIKSSYVRIGDGSAVQQLVYVGNLAHAHLLACRELLDADREGRNPACAGSPYFITDAVPENFFRFFDRIVEESGYPIRPENLWIPKGLMMTAGIIAESLAWLMRPFMHWNPKVSRFAVNYICSDFTFNSNAANRDFGFSPKFDNGEALNRTAHWFRLNGPTEAPVISPEPAVSG